MIRTLPHADCTVHSLSDDTAVARLRAKRRSLVLVKPLRDAAVAIGDTDGDRGSVHEDIHVLIWASTPQFGNSRAKIYDGLRARVQTHEVVRLSSRLKV